MWGDCDRDDLKLHSGGEVPVQRVECQGGLNENLFAEKVIIVNDIMGRL